MNMVAIYALCEPTTGAVRYVGKADDPERRLRSHVEEAAARQMRTHRGKWIMALRRDGLRPEMRVLEWVPAAQWREAECAWIRECARLGADLTNATLGGEGGYIAASQSPEARAKRAASNQGKKRSPEFRQRLSEQARGRAVSTEAREKIRQARLGVSPSQETRRKLSVASTGVRKSERHAENIGRAKQGESHPASRLTVEVVMAIRRDAAAGVSQACLANRHGIDPSHVNKIVRRKAWRHI